MNNMKDKILTFGIIAVGSLAIAGIVIWDKFVFSLH